MFKIAFLANGQSVHTRRWVNYFASRGYNVHLLTFKKPDVPLQGVNVHLLKGPLYRVRSTYLTRTKEVLSTSSGRRLLTGAYTYNPIRITASYLMRAWEVRRVINKIKPAFLQ